MKPKVTVACSLSENEKVVPVGVFARLIRASWSLSRHLVADWRARATAGGKGVSLGIDGDVAVPSPLEVAARASVVNV